MSQNFLTYWLSSSISVLRSLIFQVVGKFHQWSLYLRILEKGLRLKITALYYPRLLTGFGILVFFTNLNLMEFQVRYLALFLLSSVIDSFEWFWMESFHKNIQLMLYFLKAPLTWKIDFIFQQKVQKFFNILWMN